MKPRLIIILFVVILCNFAPGASSKEINQACFKCHTEFSEKDYKLSIHGQFSCFVCHRDLKLDEHIKEPKPARPIWRKNLNTECYTCHDFKTLSSRAQHSKAVLDQILCSECHNPHITKSMEAEKRAKEERVYCITCHGRPELKKRFKNGENISLYVDEKQFLKSAHGKNRCSFCHTDFSKEKHPKNTYESKRDFIEEHSPKICLRCHAEECKRYERCVHGAVSKKKDPKSGPVCSDCHKPHYVRLEKDDEDLHLQRCIKCHVDVYGPYKESVHYKGWKKGNKNAPLCTGCHKPHDVLITSFNLKNNEICFNCHKNIEKKHVQWFYNPPFKSTSFVKFHLESITCNVCHSKEKEGAVYFHPYDKRTKEPITVERLGELIVLPSGDINKYLDKNSDGYVNANELWKVFNDLVDKNVAFTLIGWMDVRNPVLSHLTEPKEKALRNCEVCHRADSPFFRDAFVVLRDRYGWPTVFKAHKDVLSTKSALSPLSDFYVFGSTRLAIVDFLLILAILGALLVPSIHIILRLWTRKWRKRGSL
ncbi:MAG: cytochrome c3 family protein [Deltaproteobacteria bacterium]|nr:cytochrome c3 family protein [Deltaproteobacteria bacterium]